MKNICFRFIGLGIVFAIFSWSVTDGQDEPVHFNRDIRPVLATHCLTCHGPDEATREAGVRLDRFEDATAEAESGEFPIVPFKVNESELIRRVTLPKDDSERMPPTGEGLSPAEVSQLKKWIATGAKYEKHWSFVSPSKPAIPRANQSEWVRNAIDAFVLARLEKEALRPNRAADRYVICRRVYLDLTGLPPTIEQADRFVNDPNPDAYERMVDRVLASPKFGERWARIWLDLARYADSQGYAQDSSRTIYRYRDWVIDAINANQPFDEFTIDQIAGDMLENPTNEQILATAFHRNTMTNSEGGTNDEEFRSAAVVDRVNTTMQVWMGLTMGCAQCHTHKYDPLSQEEYFQVYAILNQTEDADRGNEAPLHNEISALRKGQVEALNRKISALEEKLKKQAPSVSPRKVKLAAGPLKTRFVRIQGLGKMFLHLAEIEVFSGGTNIARKGKASQSSTAFNGPPQLGNDGNTSGLFDDQSVTHTAEEMNPWWEVDLQSSIPIEKVTVWNRTDGVGNRLKSFRVIFLDEKRRPIWTTTTNEVPSPSKAFKAPIAASQLSGEEQKALLKLLAESGTGLTADGKQLKDLKAQLAKLSKPDVTTPIMKQLPLNRQRVTKIHIRGNFRSLGKQVQPGVPVLFPQPEQKNGQLDRLEFARWLVDSKNPLTSRVIVNRYWENLFGTGIVKTSEDFGTQGELPSHPQLLDYLAIQFMEKGWDTKWLIKEIVCSSTYRQSSQVSRELGERDPENRLLARGPRFRISAEMVRDQALFIAGSLSTKMNGPSVRPPKPKLGLRAAFGGTTDWNPSPGEDSYRRGLYTSWRRTAPYPSMTTFDAPSREFCTLRRSRTNTPLQALVTMNDPVYVEASRQLAKAVLQDVQGVDSRLKYAFRKTLIRPPRNIELELLRETLLTALSRLPAEQARELNGTTKVDGVSDKELASWVVVCNVLLNLDETLSRP